MRKVFGKLGISSGATWGQPCPPMDAYSTPGPDVSRALEDHCSDPPSAIRPLVEDEGLRRLVEELPRPRDRALAAERGRACRAARRRRRWRRRARCPGSRRTPSASDPSDDRVEAECVDEARHGGEVGRIVAGDGDGLAACRPGGPGLVLEVVVAHVVERLDDARPRTGTPARSRWRRCADRSGRRGRRRPPTSSSSRRSTSLPAQRVDRNACGTCRAGAPGSRRRPARRRRAAVARSAPGARTSTVSAIFVGVAGAGDQHVGSRPRQRAGPGRCRPCRRRGCRCVAAVRR